MSDSLPIEPSPEDKDLIMLVSKYLDQQLSDDEIKRLEDRLQSDPAAMRYCAEQICLHARLHTLSTPLRINIHEGRNLVIEQQDDQSTLTTNTVNQITIGSPPSPPSKEVTLTKKHSPRLLWAIVITLLAILLTMVIYWWPSKNTPTNSWTLIPLENASFELGEANDGHSTRNMPGWQASTNPSSVVIFNPTNIDHANPIGQAHLIRAHSLVDGTQLLRLNRTNAGALGWVKQKLHIQTTQGSKIAQLGDLNGKTIRVTMLVGRPQKEAGEWNNPVNLRVSIQEEAPPYRSAAEYRIDTGSSKWSVADINLALDYDQIKEISFDLKMNSKQMRGNAYLVLEADGSTASGAEVYIDKIELRVVE